jgi:hypothetical protein
MKIFETAGFCLVTIAAKCHAADPTFYQLFEVAHCTILLAFVFTAHWDMPQALFEAYCLESIIVIVEEHLLIRICSTGYPTHLVNLLNTTKAVP